MILLLGSFIQILIYGAAEGVNAMLYAPENSEVFDAYYGPGLVIDATQTVSTAGGVTGSFPEMCGF